MDGVRQCLFCSQSFAEAAELKSHCVDAHPDSAFVACKEVPCGCIFSSDAELRSHLARAHSYNCCTHCQKQFKYKTKLKAHLRNYHHTEDVEPLGTDFKAALGRVCEEYEREKSELPAPRSEELRSVLQWWCAEPSFRRLKTEGVKREERRGERGSAAPERKAACALCARALSNAAAADEIHKCVFLECAETFASKDELLYHIKTVH